MAERTGRRPFRGPLIALGAALAALYGAWLAGRAPVAPHQVLAYLLDLSESPRAWLESFVSMWQIALVAFLPAPAWSARQRCTVVGVGLALTALYQIWLGTPYWWLYAYMFFGGAGTAAMLFLLHQWRFAADAARRAAAAYLLGGVLIFAAFGVLTKTYLALSSAVAVPVLDLSALQLDRAAFGFSPSAWAVELARGDAVLRRVLAIAYEVLPLAMMAVFGLEARAPRRMPFGLLKGMFIAGFTAAAMYALTPVTGPLYAFGAGFAQELAPLLRMEPAWLATQPGFAPRNAFPSFHWAWALLAVMLTVRFRASVRIAFGGYALLVGLSTLTLGEHYLIDLVGAFPALVLIAAVCTETVGWRSAERWQAALAGAVMYLVWAVLLQPAVASVAKGWPLALGAWCAASVAASVILYLRLAARVPPSGAASA